MEPHNCCVCLETAEKEFNLVGFGCCSAKVCLKCKVKLDSCPQCRVKCTSSAVKCKICAFRNITKVKPNMLIMQVAVQMYDDITKRRKTSRKIQLYDDLYVNYCYEHQLELIHKLRSLGCHTSSGPTQPPLVMPPTGTILDANDNFTHLYVEIGFSVCHLCGWYKNLESNCDCDFKRKYETNTYETNAFKLLGHDDEDDEYEVQPFPLLSIPDVKFSDV